jgi:hypothetical protein
MVMEVCTSPHTGLVIVLITSVVPNTPEWPSYADEANNFVFRKDRSYIEGDSDREEGVGYINSLVR